MYRLVKMATLFPKSRATVSVKPLFGSVVKSVGNGRKERYCQRSKINEQS